MGIENNINIIDKGSENKKNKKKLSGKNKKLLNQIIFLLILLILSIFLIIYILNFSKIFIQKNSVKLRTLISENEEKNDELNSFKKKSEEFKNYKKIWDEEIPKVQKDIVNINYTYFNNLLSIFPEKDFINKINLNFFEPNIIATNLTKSNIKIYSLKINLNFKTLDEKYIFLLLKYLKQNVSGYLVLQSMNINKDFEINKYFVKQMINGKLINLLSVDLVLYLYYVKK